LIPAVAAHRVSGRSQVEIALAIATHCGDGAMGLAAVELPHHEVVGPVAIDEVAADADVEFGDRKAFSLEEADEVPLEDAAGACELGAMNRECAAQRSGAATAAAKLRLNGGHRKAAAKFSGGENVAEVGERDGGGAVDEGARHGGDGEAVVAGGFELSRLMDPDARARVTPPGAADVDEVVPILGQSPPGGRRTVAQRCVAANPEKRSDEVTLPGDRPVPYGVDAGMDAVQKAGINHARDDGGAETEGQQLPVADDPELPRREPSDAN
jgi:hypothetical protein